MNRFASFLLLLALLAFAGSAQAANFSTYPYDSCSAGSMGTEGGTCYVTAASYNLTLKQATLVRSDGTEFDLMDPGEEWTQDIAAVDVNAIVSDAVSDIDIPHGTYTGLIVSLDRSVTGTTSSETTSNSKGCSGQNFSSDLVFDNVTYLSLPSCGAGQPNSTVEGCRTTGDIAKFFLPLNFTFDGTQAIHYSLKINTSRAAKCQFAGAVTTGVGGIGLVDIQLEASN